MKRIIISIISCLCMATYLTGQCPTSDVTITTQQEIDDFETTYPGCTFLNRKLTIDGSDVVNLAGLSHLVGTNKRIIIKNTNITDLSGLDNLASCTNLFIDDNPDLISLTGLSNLMECNHLRVMNNAALVTISSLDVLNSTTNMTIINNQSLEVISSFENLIASGNMIISNNEMLTSIPLFNNLENLENLTITNNENLLSISGFENVHISTEIEIQGNTSLESIDGFNSLGFFYGSIKIINNQSLVSIDGFGNTTLEHLTIKSNDELLSINGFNGSSIFYEFRIENNPKLDDISGFVNADIDIGATLVITNNSSLSECSMPTICSLIQDEVSIWSISGNSTGCNTEAGILAGCGICLLEVLTGNYDFGISVDCPGDCVDLDVWVEGGNVGEVSLVWSDGQEGNVITVCPTETTVYNVVGTDLITGCTSSSSCFVDVLGGGNSSIVGPNEFCGDSDLELVVDSDVPISDYLWSTGETTESIEISSSGVYGVTVTTDDGCESTDILIVDDCQCNVEIASTSPICPGEYSILIASESQFYSWSTGEAAPFILVTEPGEYSVTVSDISGCEGYASIDVLSLEDFNDFESGWGVWNDGGDDAALSSNSIYANSGESSLLIKDNTTTSVITSNAFPFADVAAFQLEFNYIVTGFNNANHDFWLQTSNDDGATFTTIQEWNLGDEFENEVREFETLFIEGPFTDQTKIRFRCDAAGNNDKVYIDDILVTACDVVLPTCEDGIQNGDETGIDCGGANCTPCSPCMDINFNDVEVDWGIWNDGGDDAARSNKAAFANSGMFSFLIKDNTSTSVMTTDPLDLSIYDSLSIDFNYIADGFNNSTQDFWLQISTDNGATFTTVADWVFDVDFVNGVREFVNTPILGPFTSETLIRFRCDATGNNDKIYLDDILITACDEGNSLIIDEAVARQQKNRPEVIVYPNPIGSSNALTVEFTAGHNFTTVEMYDLSGRQMINQIITANQQMLNLEMDQLNAGTYILKLTGSTDVFVEKVMVVE